MAYAPANSESSASTANANIRSNFTKEEVGCRVIRNEKEWKWGKQVSMQFNVLSVMRHVVMSNR
jgi:hypothetical protein